VLRVSRRDFRPYGEEIYRPNQGTDKVRQKFTGYERDAETDLDFAQARIYANKLGRFNSTDPLLASARIEMAQSWNRYAYVLNNPLRLTDPTGMFDWGDSLGGTTSDDDLQKTKAGTKIYKKRQEIIGKLNALQGLTAETAKKMGLSADQFAKIQRAVNAYGNANDKNGVKLEIGKVKEGVAETKAGLDASGNPQFFNVGQDSKGNINSVTANVVVTFDNLDLDTIIHEGDHVAGRQDLAADVFKQWSGGNLSFDPAQSQANLLKYERENAAYHTESYYVQYSGGETQVWKKGWSEATRQTQINNKIASGYKDSLGKPITPKNQGDRLYRTAP
jgi:RHS repeat-associated protein